MTQSRRPAAASHPWLIPSRGGARVRLRLFTFPYAGGGAGTYRQWQSAMPEDIEVCPVHLPGRERRFRETPFVRVEPLIESFAAAMLPWLDRPFALFGHSMGAIIAYELARLLAPRPAASLLLRVFLSARAAPHLPSTEPILHNLPDDEFIAELRQLKGTPEALLDDREAMRVMMPLVRADFQLTETYVHRPGPPLRCGLSVFGGRDDVWVDEGMLQDWRAYTDGPFRLRMMQGDHFYINDAPDALLSAIRDDLLHAMRPGRDRPAPFQTVR